MFISSPKGCLAFHGKAVDTPKGPLLGRFNRWPDRARVCFISPYPFVKNFLQCGFGHS